MIFIVKRAAKAVLAASTVIVDNGRTRDDFFVVDLEKKADDNSSAKATPSNGFASSGIKNASNEAAASCDPAD